MQYELEGQEISRPHELTVLKKAQTNSEEYCTEQTGKWSLELKWSFAEGRESAPNVSNDM